MRLKNILRFRGLQGLFRSINPRTIYLYSIVIGLLSGLGAIVFNELLHAAIGITMETWARLPLPPMPGEGASHADSAGPPRRWLLLLLHWLNWARLHYPWYYACALSAIMCYLTISLVLSHTLLVKIV